MGFYAVVCHAYSGVSFYVVPHAEDWQIFMGGQAWADMHGPANKVVIITITAGNYFTGYLPECCRVADEPPSKKAHYWDANEAGEIASIDLASNTQSPPRTGGGLQTRLLNAHQIQYYSNNNVTAYFLRIDENLLNKWIEAKPGGKMRAADESTEYADYDDLMLTIATIYKYEIRGNAENKPVTINTFDYEANSNPGDHSTHYFTGNIASAAICMMPDLFPSATFTGQLYQGFNMGSQPVNLDAGDSSKDIQHKAAVYGAYCLAMLDANAQIDWQNFPTEGYSSSDFLNREYSRPITFDGNCPGVDKASAAYMMADTEGSVKIYPVPADQQVTVQIDGYYHTLLNIKLIDLYGRTVLQYRNISTLTQNQMSVGTGNLVAGSYLLEVDNGMNIIYKRVLAIQHQFHP